MKKNTRTSWAVLVVAVLMFSRAASAQYSKIDLSFDETPPAAGQNETINLNFPTALQPEPTVYLFYVLGAAPCATPLACLGNFIPIGLGTLDEFNYAAMRSRDHAHGSGPHHSYDLVLRPVTPQTRHLLRLLRSAKQQRRVTVQKPDLRPRTERRLQRDHHLQRSDQNRPALSSGPRELQPDRSVSRTANFPWRCSLREAS